MSNNFKITSAIKFVLLGLLLVFVLASMGFGGGPKNLDNMLSSKSA
jgi:hypothetical protein